MGAVGQFVVLLGGEPGADARTDVEAVDQVELARRRGGPGPGDHLVEHPQQFTALGEVHIEGEFLHQLPSERGGQRLTGFQGREEAERAVLVPAATLALWEHWASAAYPTSGVEDENRTAAEEPQLADQRHRFVECDGFVMLAEEAVQALRAPRRACSVCSGPPLGAVGRSGTVGGVQFQGLAGWSLIAVQKRVPAGTSPFAQKLQPPELPRSGP